jgi:hypothetical protein
LEKNLMHCHFVNLKSFMDWPEQIRDSAVTGWLLTIWAMALPSGLRPQLAFWFVGLIKDVLISYWIASSSSHFTSHLHHIQRCVHSESYMGPTNTYSPWGWQQLCLPKLRTTSKIGCGSHPQANWNYCNECLFMASFLWDGFIMLQ